MLCVYGSPLYQWDINRQLKIDSVDIHSDFKIHCCHKEDSSALVVEPIFDGDSILVNIPNILLQRSGFLRVYVVIEGDTVFDASFYVMARPKPDDYVYTETEVWTVESAVEDALREAKESGEFDGEDGYTPIKGVDYFTDEDKQEIADLIPVKDGGNGSVIVNDTEENETNIANSFIGGKDNDATLKGFKITGVDSSGGLWLDSVEGLTEGTLVAHFKETDNGVVRYRDKVASIGGVCKQCTKNIGSKYPIALATPTIDGNDNDSAWLKAPFVKDPTITANNIYDNASLKFTYDTNGDIYFRLYVKLKDTVNHNNIEITIRPPYEADIKARFFGDDKGIHLEEGGSTITEAYITRKTTDFREFLFEIKVPTKAHLPFFGGADILVNVGCYFTRSGTSNTAGFNWGGIGVNWSPEIKWDMSKAINGWLLGHCDHGELVMFEDEIKTGIVNGAITLVDAEDTYYANGSYIIARATDKGWDDIGTSEYAERTTIGSTTLTTKFGDHVSAFVDGRNNLVSIDAVAFGHSNDALGYQAVAFGRYNRVYGDRSAAFGYKNTVVGHEALAEGVKNNVYGFAGHAEGESNNVNGDYGHGEGWDNEVNGWATHVEGIANKGYGQAQHVQGMFAEIDKEGKYLHIVGNGTDYDKRSNAHTIDRKGNAWFASGVILTSPNGTRYKITVAEGGTLKVSATTD